MPIRSDSSVSGGKPQTKYRVVASRYAQNLTKSTKSSRGNQQEEVDDSKRKQLTTCPQLTPTKHEEDKTTIPNLSVQERLQIYKDRKAKQQSSAAKIQTKRPTTKKSTVKTNPIKSSSPTFPYQVTKNQQSGAALEARGLVSSASKSQRGNAISTPKAFARSDAANSHSLKVECNSTNLQRELDIYSNLYSQLQFCHNAVESTFLVQQHKAHIMLFSAWEQLESKKCSLNSILASLRNVNRKILLQACSDAQLKNLIDLQPELKELLTNLPRLCSKLESSLNRMPIQHVQLNCRDLSKRFADLKKFFSSMLSDTSFQDAKKSVNDYGSLFRQLEITMNKICPEVQNIAELLDRIKNSVDTESSMKIEILQQKQSDNSFSI